MGIISVLGTIGFLVCLFIMNRMENGANGIRKYDVNFRSLDMQFRYDSNKVYYTFEKLGVDGRNAYCNFLISDFCFIICFFILMFSITKRFIKNDILRKALIVLVISRAIFDVLENILLILLMKHYPTQNILLANVCSWATTMKFIALFLWLFGFVGAMLLSRKTIKIGEC